jgi:hypothetical protein
MSKPALTITHDKVDEFNDIVKRFKSDDVLVGIPAADKARKDSDPINNASILFINEFGSPAQNIPPRPVMAIGIKNAQEAIVQELKNAFLKAFDQGVSALNVYYNRAGLVASQSVKKAINDQDGIDGPSEATLKSRKAQGFNGTKSLIVTGQLRNSITYVVREKS